MKRILFACIALCVFFMNAKQLYAQPASSRDDVVDTENPPEPSVDEDTDEDLAVGTVAQEIPDVRTTETLSGSELEETKGLSLGGALKSINGVRAVENGSTAKPMVHGLFGARLLILVDGIRHEAQSWGLDHAPEIDANAAGSLTVVKGAGGVRYGSKAIGGVILVDPPRLPLEPGSKGSVSIVGNSNDRSVGGSASLRGRSTQFDALGWRVQTSVKKAGSASTPNYVLDNTGHEDFNASGAVYWDKPNYQLQLGASRYRSKLGVFTGQVAENANQFRDLVESDQPLGVEAYTFDYDIERPRQEVDHTLLYSRLKFDLAPSFRTSLQVSHQINARLEFDKVRRSIDGPQLDFDLRTTTANLLAEFDAFDFVFGGFGVRGGVQENVYSGQRLIPNYRTFSGAVFAWSQFVFDSWEAELGARLDYESVESFQRERIGGASATINQNDFDYLTPSFVVGALWRPVDQWRSKLTLSSASRAPSVNELFIDGVSQGLAAFEKGDQNLDVERVYAINLDATYAPLDWLSAKATGYAHYFDGYINLEPELGDDGSLVVTPTVNGGFPSFAWRQSDAIFYGADAEIKARPLRWLSLTSKASVVFAKDTENDRFLTLVPPPFFEQEVRFTQTKLGPLSDSYISATSALTLRQTRFEKAADFVDPPPAAHLLHLGVGTQWKTNSGQVFGASLMAKNLLNTNYRNYLSRLRYFADEPGRSIFLRLKVEF